MKGQRRKLPVMGGHEGGSRLATGDPHSDVPRLSQDLSRRDFVTVLSSAMAAVGATGCNEAPQEEILPYVDRPPEVVPGVARYYATSTERAGYGFGLLAECHEGRPTKLEGHPGHPASLGATLAGEQAELLNLYDPDRARSVRHQNSMRPFGALRRALGDEASGLLPQAGRGLHLLLEPTASPLMQHLLRRVRQRFPDVQMHFDPARAPLARWQATRRLFGRPLDPQLDLSKANVVVDVGSDFLMALPMSVRWARDFADSRDIQAPHGTMSRLYSMETALTVTGATADERLALRPSRFELVLAALLARVAAKRPDVPEVVRAAAQRGERQLEAREQAWLDELEADALKQGKSVVFVVGERQPSSVHALAQALNAALTSEAIQFSESALLDPETSSGGAQKFAESSYALQPLLSALDRDQVKSLFVLGGNPSYSLPGDARFAERFARAQQRVVLGLYEHETAQDATWFVPQSHFLESWGDARAYDGTVSFRQPTVRSLFGGKSREELLALMAGLERPLGRWPLRDYWTDRLGSEAPLSRALARGRLDGGELSLVKASIDWKQVEQILAELQPLGSTDLELDVSPDPRLEDGRYANNAWLQETPEPVTKLVWDNAALLNPETARERDLQRGDLVRLEKDGTSVLAPVLPATGQAEGAVTLWLGYGRQGKESIARGVGIDVAPLRTLDSPWTARALTLTKTSKKHRLVTTQDTFDMHDRAIALHQTLDGWKKHPKHFQHHDEEPPTLYAERASGGVQWGMAIDLNRCTGCSACVTACVAENNIPTVGKELVAMGREMHWMRIDTYHVEHKTRRAATLMQPMLCQHCEKAPCEYVCPVNATVHSPDGLNEMVYNRCVGTRFCSNNCPYKVRRFNWYEFNDQPREPKAMVFNPDVTVRARGVMEKCTFCVQRIRRAEIDAKLEQRPLRDGDVTTACQQVCPARAITFGSLNDDDSPVAKNARSKRAYGCLSDLGTRPRVRYLGRVSNAATRQAGGDSPREAASQGKTTGSVEHEGKTK